MGVSRYFTIIRFNYSYLRKIINIEAIKMKVLSFILLCLTLMLTTSAYSQVNSAPVIQVPQAQDVAAMQLLIFEIKGSDPDTKQTLTFTASGMPSLASLNKTSPTTAQFRWIPTPDQKGPYRVTFKVTDNGSPSKSDSGSVIITIRKNGAPTITIPSNITSNPDQAISFTVIVNDPDDGQPLSILADYLPSGARFVRNGGAKRAQFDWTPTGRQTGTFNIKFTVEDKGSPSLSQTKTLSIIVNNTPPVISIPNAQAAITGYPITFNIQASDVDSGQTLEISATRLPIGAILRKISSSRTEFSWRPTESQIGTVQLLFNVKDNGTPVKTTTQMLEIKVARPERWIKASSDIPLNTIPGRIYDTVTSIQVIGTNLLAATNNGLYISTDKGNKWTPVNSGLTDLDVKALAVSGTNLFAGTKSGLFLSVNNGQQWTKIVSPLTDINGLLASGNILLARTPNAVYVSTDGGSNWTLSFNKGPTVIDDLAIDSGSLYISTQPNLCRSSNNGVDWACYKLGNLNPAIASPIVVNSNRLIAGSGSLTPPVVSNDYGANWSDLPIAPSRQIRSYQKLGSNLLFAGTVDGVFLSTNFGQSWIIKYDTIKNISHFVMMGNILFAATSNGEIFQISISGSY